MSAAAAAQAGASLAQAVAGLVGTSMQIRAAASQRRRQIRDLADQSRERVPGQLKLLREQAKLTIIQSRRQARAAARQGGGSMPLILAGAGGLVLVLVLLKGKKRR